jgi:hypothetical protein
MNGRQVFYGLDYLLIGLDADTGEQTFCELLRPSDRSTGSFLQPILSLAPMPGDQIAVGMWDGRVAVVGIGKK